MNNLVPCAAVSLAAAAIFEIYAAPGDWMSANARQAVPAMEAVQTIDRSLKGDRLRTIPSVTAQQRAKTPALPQARELPSSKVPQSDQKLPEACEPVVSPILRSPLSQRSGRCVT